MVFSAVMIEWFNECYKEWFNEIIFQLLSEIICIVDALLFALWNSEINCYLLGIGFGELRVMWGGGGAIRACTFTWLVLFSREY